MAVSYVQTGRTREYTAGGALSSGDVVVLGLERLGILQDTLASGETGTVATEGVYTLAADNATAFVQGDRLYWDTTAEKLYKTAANGRYFAGYCFEPKAQTDTTGLVKLAPFREEGARQITLNATGNQILGAENFLNGAGLVVKVPNTAALSVTFPSMATVPAGVYTLIQKSSSDAFAVSVAADAGDTLVGTVGTIDAVNDRATLVTTSTGPTIAAASIIA